MVLLIFQKGENMIIEAFDSKQTKYKIGMECKVKNLKGLWYIVDLMLDKSDKLNGLRIISSDFTAFADVKFMDYPKDLTLTGNYEPDFLKLRRKLAK